MPHTYVGGFSKLYVKIFVLFLKKMILNTNYHIYLLITSPSPSKIWIFLDFPTPVPCATTRHLTCQATNTWWSTTSRPSSTRRTGWTKHTRTRPSGASWVSRCLAVADGVNCSKRGTRGNPFENGVNMPQTWKTLRFSKMICIHVGFPHIFVCLQGRKFDLNGI